VVAIEEPVGKDEVTLWMSMRPYRPEKDTITDPDAPLRWWSLHHFEWPILHRLARRLLAIPATATPIERVWSRAGLIASNRRANISPENLDKLLFLNVNDDAYPMWDFGVPLDLRRRVVGTRTPAQLSAEPASSSSSSAQT